MTHEYAVTASQVLSREKSGSFRSAAKQSEEGIMQEFKGSGSYRASIHSHLSQ